MSVLRNRAPRMAAVFLGLALGATSLATIPAADAAPGHAVQRADAPVTVVSRISLNTGPLRGGNVILVQGHHLATEGDNERIKKTVTFGVLKQGEFVDGSVEVPAEDVYALSEDAILVSVPEGDPDLLAVSVYVGDAVKGPKYTYVPAGHYVDTDQATLDTMTPTAEAGLTGDAVKIEGEDFDAKTTVVVGGKKVKTTVSADRTELAFSFPAGLVGIQDVVVTDKYRTSYVGYVNYTAIQPELDEDQDGVDYAVTEAPTTVTVTGTNLNQLATGTLTYDGQAKAEKVTVKAVKGDNTKALVTIPKGTAAAEATVTLSTKFAKTVEFDIVRKASPAPTVTAVEFPEDVTKGGAATLTGTNLIGLKTLVLTKDSKDIKGSVTAVTSSTGATVKLPKLADGDYTLKASTWNTTAATCDFTVEDGDIADNGCAADDSGDDGGDDTPAATPPAPTAASWLPTGAGAAGGVISLDGTNLAVGQLVRYYLGSDPSAALVVDIDFAGSTWGNAVVTPEQVDAVDNAPGTYHVQVSGDNGTTWSTAVDMVVVDPS